MPSRATVFVIVGIVLATGTVSAQTTDTAAEIASLRATVDAQSMDIAALSTRLNATRELLDLTLPVLAAQLQANAQSISATNSTTQANMQLLVDKLNALLEQGGQTRALVEDQMNKLEISRVSHVRQEDTLAAFDPGSFKDNMTAMRSALSDDVNTSQNEHLQLAAYMVTMDDGITAPDGSKYMLTSLDNDRHINENQATMQQEYTAWFTRADGKLDTLDAAVVEQRAATTVIQFVIALIAVAVIAVPGFRLFKQGGLPSIGRKRAPSPELAPPLREVEPPGDADIDTDAPVMPPEVGGTPPPAPSPASSAAQPSRPPPDVSWGAIDADPGVRL